MKANKSVSLKVVVVLLALVMLIGCAVGGTIAWLMTNTDPVTNTFAASNIHITLTETSGNTYKMIPGKTYAKDPVVSVLSTTDVDCWLFFKVETENTTYLEYTLNTTGWTELGTNTGIYYRSVNVSDSVKSWNLLVGKDGYENGFVTVSDDLTLENMTSATLKFTAYAIQKEGFDTAADAWAELN